MTARREELLATLWNGDDPLGDHGAFAGRVDFQGWASNNPMLTRAIDEARPRTVVEVGVWKGGSVITMAQRMKALGIDGAVIAVDTWLGSAEHWLNSPYRPSLHFEAGYPMIYRTFAANIVASGLQEMVLPLPLDSINAAEVLQHHELRPDVLHIDGGHNFASVISDLRAWWPMLRPGGILLGDDYHPTGIDTWPEVRAAFHDFFSVDEIENFGGKCFIRKNEHDA